MQVLFSKICSPAIFSLKRHSAADSDPRREAEPRPKIEQSPGNGPSVDHPGIDAVPDPDSGYTRKNASHPVIHEQWEAAHGFILRSIYFAR